jgi:hypothetical protein
MTALTHAPGWRTLERDTIVTPLGIRFWDPATDMPVGDGLTVTAVAERTSRPVASARRTRGGVHAFHHLPGLQAFEYPSSDAPASLPAGGRVLVNVDDATRRFMPVAFYVNVPFDGIYPNDLPVAPGSARPPGFYLFSAPARPAVPAVAVVRAQLAEQLTSGQQVPAANAVVEIDVHGGDTWTALADAAGSVALLFPYPTFTLPPAGTSLQLLSAARQSWPVTIRVRYQPSALEYPGGVSPPDLRSVLAQAPAALWNQAPASAGVALASLPATLVFDQELVLRTQDESVLLVSAGSLA